MTEENKNSSPPVDAAQVATPKPNKSTAMSDDVVAAFREAFKQFDTDDNGTISDIELKVVLDGLGIKSTHTEVVQLIKEVDSNQNGTIDFSEFLKIMSKKMSDTDSSEMVAIAFGAFDKDGDGQIGVDDLCKVLSELGETLTKEEALQLIRCADKNNDNLLDQDEFTAWVDNN